MDDPSQTRTNFVAVLVFADGVDRRTIESHVFTATHPEIAYQLALKYSKEGRFGREFVGFAELWATEEEVVAIGRTERGSPHELVVEKHDLGAFQDPRWANTSPNTRDMLDALRGPISLIHLDGLDQIAWETHEHAYGPATDVPLDLARLASSDRQTREEALWQLHGTICHQGSVYGATVPALPFLLHLAGSAGLPDRVAIFELVAEIARSAAFDPAQIRETWEGMARRNPGFAPKAHQIAESEVANRAAVLQALRRLNPSIVALTADPDPEISEIASAILTVIWEADP